MKKPILAIVAGLLVAIAVAVSGTAATATASGASTSATMIKVRIHLKGTLDAEAGIGRGRFTLSGVTYTRVGGTLIRSSAIPDRGTFVDRFLGQLARPPIAAYLRTLRGANGTIWVRGDRVTSDRKGNWIVIKGSRAYAGLRGLGKHRGLYGGRSRLGWGTIDVTMTGTLSQ
jgi:hypothetical protein